MKNENENENEERRKKENEGKKEKDYTVEIGLQSAVSSSNLPPSLGISIKKSLGEWLAGLILCSLSITLIVLPILHRPIDLIMSLLLSLGGLFGSGSSYKKGYYRSLFFSY